jgi:hypothetical protein
MNRDEARALVTAVTAAWEADPATDVVWSGVYEGRPGIRISQRCRDFTTVWFDVGDRTVRFEAYLLPSPPHDPAAVYRLCLARNWGSWPASIAIDRDGDLHVVGHLPLSDLDPESLDRAVGAVYDTVERSFRPLLRLGFTRPT